MKRANYAIRREARSELTEMGFPPGQIEELFKPDFAGRVGFLSYALSNNRANARRIMERVRTVEAQVAGTDIRLEGAGYVYREDLSENRVMFEFPDKPDADTRDLLKRHAFKWSPSRGAWVRQHTTVRRYAGKLVREALDAASAWRGKGRGEPFALSHCDLCLCSGGSHGTYRIASHDPSGTALDPRRSYHFEVAR